jgi:DNA-binding beta-propeller fold protein YncE
MRSVIRHIAPGLPTGFLLGVLLLAGCASGPGPLTLAPDMGRVWPVPPDPPRVAYLHQIRVPKDAGVRKTFGQRFLAVFTGRQRPAAVEEPIGIYADRDGWMLVADPGLQVVHIYNLKRGTYAQAFELPGGRLASPVGVALDPARGRVFVSDSIRNRIFVYDTRGYYMGRFGDGLLRVSGLAWDAPRERLLAVDTGHHRVVTYDAEGRQQEVIGRRGDAPGEFNFPTHVAVAPDGTFYVSDSLNFRIQAFGADGKPLRTVGHLGGVVGTFSKPKGVAVDDAGRLYVVDGLYDVVQIFDPEGRLLMHFGGAGSGPGGFWLPAGIAVAGNDLFVADTHNGRVQLFRLLAAEPPAPGGA